MTAQFAVVLRRIDHAWRWCVTCERCNADVPIDVGGVTVIKIRGFTELLASDRDIAKKVEERLRALWDEAARSRRPMVVDRDDVQVEYIGDGIREAFERHADGCPRRSDA